MAEDHDKKWLEFGKGYITIPSKWQIFRVGILLSILLALSWHLLSTSGNRVMHISGKSLTKWDKITTGRRADWLKEAEVPEFCKRILKNPKALENGCGLNSKTMECTNFNNEVRMFSQNRQDYFLYTQHFRFLQRPGVYVDIASNWPISISNTYFFDRCLGWKGVCAEANPKYYESLYRYRSCHLIPTCVGSIDGEMVTFILNKSLGGIMGDSYKYNNRPESENVRTMPAKCTTMKLALQRENIEEVDYLSLDVEGHEAHVLRGFDFDRVKINVITVEVTKATFKEIEQILVPKGYKHHMPDYEKAIPPLGLIGMDAVFIHESVVWGSPV